MKKFFASFDNQKSADAARHELQTNEEITLHSISVAQARHIDRDHVPSGRGPWLKSIYVGVIIGAVGGAFLAPLIAWIGGFEAEATLALMVMGAGAGAIYSGVAVAISGSILQGVKVRKLKQDSAEGMPVIAIEVDESMSDDVEAILERSATTIAYP